MGFQDPRGVTMVANLILVKPSEIQNESIQGIAIASEAVAQPQDGTVMSIGPDVVDKTITVGSRVVFARYAGAGIMLNGEKHVVLKESEIYMTVGKDVDLRTTYGTTVG